MLFRLLSGGDLRGAIIGIALSLPAVLLCLMVHEVCHGLAAWAQGDDTAKRAGRLTFDPFSHLDPMGFGCMVLFGFGWARPVPVNISNFHNRRRGMALTALAGPLSNFVLAFLFFLAYVPLQQAAMGGSIFLAVVAQFCMYTAQLSVGLGVFNLIPVYPLDGSRILDAALPFDMQRKLEGFVRRYQTIIMLAVIAIVWFGGLSSIISWVANRIYSLSLLLLGAVGFW